MNKNKYNKENIKDRMFKNAASFWGVRNIENFDPLVKLIIESLASEIYNLSNEINTIETRILERVAYALTPDMRLLPHPAHMLIHTYPIEEKCIINKRTGFYYEDPVFRQKNNISDISFYPVDGFLLTKTNVKTLVCGKNIYTLDKFLNREIFTRSTVRSDVFSRNLWFGLEIDSKIENLKDVSFYFDFINADNKNEYFHLLPFTQWQHNFETLKLSHGIHTVKNELEMGDISLFSHYDPAIIADDNIRQFYNHRFLTIKNDCKVSTMKKELFPEELHTLFSDYVVSQMQEPLYWFKVTFPPNFNEEIMERILISTNVFPAANKGLRSQTSRNLKLSNTIPLFTQNKEYFLSVQSVVDSRNRLYKQLPFRDKETNQYGTYSIKRGGTERFDLRDAKEQINGLVDRLRDEGTAFAQWGRGFLEKTVEELNIKITAMEQKLNKIEQQNELSSYLIIDSESQEDEIIYVDYWITNCELVNDIKAGTFFSPSLDTFVETKSTVSMTPCIGGKSRPSSTTVLDTYKYILTSKDSIYTSEDIVNFCFAEHGELITSVEVKKGIQVSSKPKEGLIRTIDVFLDLKKQFDSDPSEDLKNNLYNTLIKKSPDSYNYRIFINKQKTE